MTSQSKHCSAVAKVIAVLCEWSTLDSDKISSESIVCAAKFHHGDLLASLASSGESDDGGLAPPPRKKSRTLDATMQQAANGCTQRNGVSEDHSASSSQQNGTEHTSEINAINGGPNGEISAKIIDKTNQDIVRLIGQHLKTIGLKYVCLI